MRATDNEIIIVLTVGSQAQKRLCKALISQMNYTVRGIEILCDDDFGQRIGSGGAVLNVLDKYYGRCQKLVIINCGGFSKRTVSCAVKGKAFARILDKGRTVTLLEYILGNVLSFLPRFEKGAVIACSDILPDASFANASFSQSTGFGVPCDIETGTRHGVMEVTKQNELKRFLHKADSATLKKSCTDENGMVTVDTGLVYLDDKLIKSLLYTIENDSICDLIRSENVELNFYSDVMPLFAQVLDEDDYLYKGTQSPAHLAVKKILYKSLAHHSLCVYTAEKGAFVHLGTNRQLLEQTLLTAEKNDRFLKIGSYVGEGCFVGDSTVLDNVCLADGSQVGANCLVTDIFFSSSVYIDDDSAVCGFRLTDGSYVAAVTHIDENPKDILGDVEIWSVPRFYKAKSFDASLDKFNRNADEDKFSLKYCVENADVDYYVLSRRYLAGMIQSTPNIKYLDLRNRITEHFLSKCSRPIKFVPCCDAVEISMPVRVNLSGTWTDAMPYCIENGGEVINAAVTVNDTLPITVRLETLERRGVEFCSDNRKTVYSFDEHIGNDFSDFNLHKAVLTAVGMTELTHPECGLRLSTNVKMIDKGSGLGTSSILLSACFKAFSRMFDLRYSDDNIVEMVFAAEQIMKTGGGWQDQVGGLFPGVKRSASQPGIEQRVTVENIRLSAGIKGLFDDRAVLMPTGQSHFGRFIVTDVANRYFENVSGVREAYRLMKELNATMLKAIDGDDCELFLECINRHMHLLVQLSECVTDPVIDDMIESCLQVADAVSICGAGAGGYLLVFLKPDKSVDDFRLFVSERFPEIESEVLKINLFNQGGSNE